jgi:hypothetical protein
MGVLTYGAYLAMPGEHMRKILRCSRQLVPCPTLEDALKSSFGLILLTRTDLNQPLCLRSTRKHYAAEHSRSVKQQRDMRTNYMNNIWRMPVA